MRSRRRAIIDTAVCAALAGLLTVTLVATLKAEERRLSATEIQKALTGNTVQGLWSGSPYRSYFDPSGLTIYKAEGLSADHGKWRVDQETNRYCSWWARSGWGCYDVFQDGETIIWAIPETNQRYPSKLLEGKQL